ncbi:MAG: type IV secretion system DNA-binding domain-containing protein [Candidatus Zapsychrus exili]|nr:type IV secretion system DNA-binding domain-containing protein [Candidatus Zapsychrus exili]
MLAYRIKEIIFTIFPEFQKMSGGIFHSRLELIDIFTFAFKIIIVWIIFWLIKRFLGHYWEKLTNKMMEISLNLYGNKAKHEYTYYPYSLENTLSNYMKTSEFDSYTFLGLNADSKNKYATIVSDDDRQKHMQIIGMTGSGKSSIFQSIIVQDAKKNIPIVIIDGKGDKTFSDQLRSLLTSVGREKDFILFSLANKEMSETFNPLQAGECDPDIIVDAFMSNFDAGDPYYYNVAEAFFRNAYKILHGIKFPFTVMDVYAYLNCEESFRQVNEIALKHHPEVHQYLKILDVEIRKMETRNVSWRRELAGFSNYLQSFNDPLFKDADAGIVLTDCIRDKKIVYFQLPTNSYPIKAKQIGRMVQAHLRYVSALIQSDVIDRKTRASIMIDEYGAFAEESFVEILNKARSSGMMVTIGHQSLSDLSAISESFMKRIDENTLIKIILKQTDPLLCEMISKSIGTCDEEERTFRKKQGEFGNQIYTGESSLKHVKEFILHPDAIKRLHPYGQGYYISRANNTHQCLNFSYFKPRVINLLDGNCCEKKYRSVGMDLYRNNFE